MRTLCDKLHDKIVARDVHSLVALLEEYDAEKDVAKCYSAFAYLSCTGAGGSQELAELMSEVIEGFYMATSVHDDVLDQADSQVRNSNATRNSYLLLGDCFFVLIASALARASALMPDSSRELAIEKFEQYMLDTAESQVQDEEKQGNIPSPEEVVRHMSLRGGTWGRLCMELPALAGGLSPSDAANLGDAGENLFMGLTVRDDLRDLRDDLRNNVLTLAPAMFLAHQDGANSSRSGFLQADNEAQIDSLIDLLKDEAITRALSKGKQYTENGLNLLGEFLSERDSMNWFLLQMIFRLTNKRIQEFTPDHVVNDELGIGFSALNEVLDANGG